MNSHEVKLGGALEVLSTIDDKTIQCCVTSPPYWGMRQYHHDDEVPAKNLLGQENSMDQYINDLVNIFAEVHRTLKDDGVLWVNIGDKYDKKDLIGLPWLFAFAMKEFGWILRNDIIWQKPNSFPMPIKDRCNSSHEYIFMFTKQAQGYYYDIEAIMEPLVDPTKKLPDGAHGIGGKKHKERGEQAFYQGGGAYDASKLKGKIRRDVWNIAVSHFAGKHYAVYPEKIPELCIKASTKEYDLVLDPFNGSGTTGLVAKKLNRSYLGIDINAEYVKMSIDRINEYVNLDDVME